LVETDVSAMLRVAEATGGGEDAALFMTTTTSD
jgi:hypothetical protein